MTRHVVRCAAEHDTPGEREAIVQLRVDAAGDPRYWLHLEARSTASLQQLDSLLRRVWLECCGHMSAFRLRESELAMRTKVGSVFDCRGLAFSYEYDFGSTTELKGQVLAVREGSLGRAPSRLLARNDPLAWACDECDCSAVIVCPFCIHEGSCLFCEVHARTHPCAGEEAYLPVVNSPRMGICAYAG
jgi:hypothetical protein